MHGDTETAREAMVASLCCDAGWVVEAAKDEMAGDFIVTRPGAFEPRKLRVEVGGISKKPKRSDFVIRDDLDFPSGEAIPLWLLGVRY